MTETFCWNCDKAYQITAATCPACGAANGNAMLEKAQEQCAAEFVGMSDDAEPMAVYCGVSL
jgi:hypothetical protein